MDPVPAEDKLASYLLRLATGWPYRQSGQSCDVSGGYMPRVFLAVARAITHHFGGEIRLPTKEEALASRTLFEQRFGIQDCIAAADGTHIRYKPLGASAWLHAGCCVVRMVSLRVLSYVHAVEEKLSHYNHKGYHSFHLHALVDNDFLFLDVNVGTPGACGDSPIWQNTAACKAIEAPAGADGWHGFLPPRGFIVVDSAYKLTPFQITPFKRSQLGDRQKAVFNFYQSKARRCVEQAFGLLKVQYAILDSACLTGASCLRFLAMSDRTDCLCDCCMRCFVQNALSTQSRRKLSTRWSV